MINKLLKSRIFFLCLGLLIAGSIGVYAYTVSSSDVSYSNSELEGNSVKDALDDLYDKADNLSTHFDLLWTNSSPSSAFAAQTVALDLNDYDAILLQCNGTYVDGNPTAPDVSSVRVIQYIPMNANISQLSYGSYTNSTNGAVRYYRNISVTPTSVVFGAGYYTSGTNTQSDNRFAIPIHIWGIKGELSTTN